MELNWIIVINTTIYYQKEVFIHLYNRVRNVEYYL